MRIENEMLSRFNTREISNSSLVEDELSRELDIFFDNVIGTVVDYFQEKELVL